MNAEVIAWLAEEANPEPIDMILYCPACGYRHIDAPNAEEGWTNPPHKSHKCHSCKCVWRPADVPTNGVAHILTIGKADTIDHRKGV